MSDLFLDCETMRSTNAALLRRLMESVKPPGNYKKAETIAQWHATEGAAARLEAANATALNGTYGQLATIGFALNDGEVQIFTAQADGEAALLLAFFAALPEHDYYSDEWVAFNGEFDLRFIRQRAIINRVKVPNGFPFPHYGNYYDPMLEWAGRRGYIKQQELEEALGIERLDSITGAEVGEAIDAGDWDRVINHNREDVRCLREIYRRMRQ